MKPVVVFGATGYTGRLVIESLERRGAPYRIAGRDRAKLAALATSLASKPEIRVADLAHPESLRAMAEGAGAVINTVGPFRRHGAPVVEAAIARRAHYVDTTAEQIFQKEIAERFDAAARAAQVAVITGQACEFAPGYCGAAILNDRFGPLTRVDTYYRLDAFRPSRGTAKSAVGMLGQPYWTWRGGALARRGGAWRPRKARFSGESTDSLATPFPGGDEILLPRDFPSIQNASCNLVMPGRDAWAFAFFDGVGQAIGGWLPEAAIGWIERRIEGGLDEPGPAERAESRWTVVTRGEGSKGSRDTHECRVDGTDVYGITGDLAALGALWLAEGRSRASGVVTTGKALDAAAFLDALQDRGVRWRVT